MEPGPSTDFSRSISSSLALPSACSWAMCSSSGLPSSDQELPHPIRCEVLDGSKVSLQRRDLRILLLDEPRRAVSVLLRPTQLCNPGKDCRCTAEKCCHRVEPLHRGTLLLFSPPKLLGADCKMAHSCKKVPSVGLTTLPDRGRKSSQCHQWQLFTGPSHAQEIPAHKQRILPPRGRPGARDLPRRELPGPVHPEDLRPDRHPPDRAVKPRRPGP